MDTEQVSLVAGETCLPQPKPRAYAAYLLVILIRDSDQPCAPLVCETSTLSQWFSMLMWTLMLCANHIFIAAAAAANINYTAPVRQQSAVVT